MWGIRFGACLLLLTTSVAASMGPGSLFNTPSAKTRPMGLVEYGILGTTLISEGNIDRRYNVFSRWALTDRIEYGMQVLDGQTFLSGMYGQVFRLIDGRLGLVHRIGMGVQNVGWKPIGTYAVAAFDLQLNYTLSIPLYKGNYHIGLGRDAESLNVNTFLGLDQAVGFGTLIVEWEGRALNVGFKMPVSGYNAYLMTTPLAIKNVTDRSHIVSFGLSFQDNIFSLLKEQIMNPERPEIEEKISTRSILKEVEKSLAGRPKDDSNAISEAILRHMQYGLEYYYSAEYELAAEEYQLVTQLMPKSPIGYVRLGSVYLQMDKKELALKTWQKALELDPSNAELKQHIADLEKKMAP